MSVDVIIDQDVLQKEIGMTRKLKDELESKIKILKTEVSNLEKKQEILTLAKERMSKAIDLFIIENEIKRITNLAVEFDKEIQNRVNTLGYYERLIDLLEEMKK